MGLALLIGTGVMVTAAVIVKRYVPDLRSSTIPTLGATDEKAARARVAAHAAPALEAPGSPR
jgi:hypothetical protein